MSISKYFREVENKKVHQPKIWLLIKNSQFLSNQAEIQAILPTHEFVILAKFHKDWQKIVDFLVQ